MKSDFVIAGSGLFGAVFAREAADAGHSVEVFESRTHAGGNCHSTRQHGIDVHTYGPHIFNTNSKELWDYANRFAPFREYWHRVTAVGADDRAYSFPINRTTLSQIYGTLGVSDPEACLARAQHIYRGVHSNNYYTKDKFADCVASKVGIQLYGLFYEGYTRKQWGRDPLELPASMAARIPVRTTYNDRFHDAQYSGVPADGYANWMDSILDGTVIHLGVSLSRPTWQTLGKRLVWTGSIDQYFDYQLGKLEYRTLRFQHEVMPTADFQGIAQVNYCGIDVPWTRVVEHKHFNPRPRPAASVLPESPQTVVTFEYPEEWTRESTTDRYYPVPTERNRQLYEKYAELARGEPDVIFGGRLGSFRYYNMDQTIAAARTAFRRAVA